ncbi:DUF420 domain-containing protein, partial [Bacillus salipaludis]|nr:DUF420 domain-containing protein [Bacillus salipaludis]
MTQTNNQQYNQKSNKNFAVLIIAISVIANIIILALFFTN